VFTTGSLEAATGAGVFRGVFRGRRFCRRDVGVASTLGSGLSSEDGSSPSALVIVRSRRGVRLTGVVARLLVPTPGIGVPFDFRCRPRALGVASSPCSSIDCRSGTVVVVDRPLSCRAGVEDEASGNWNSLRLALLPTLSSGGGGGGSCPSVSTVTRSRCGDLRSPTCSSNICFLGELPSARSLCDD
jgi:hypothetical protein